MRINLWVVLGMACLVHLSSCSSEDDAKASSGQALGVDDATGPEANTTDADTIQSVDSESASPSDAISAPDQEGQIACVEEEGVMRGEDGKSCCEGLQAVDLVQMGESSECLAPLFYPPFVICLPCGNGTCEATEDRCTCPEDCQ